MKLTPAQRWALEALAKFPDLSPQFLGQKMMERPGAVPAWRQGHHYKAQGYGRMGGAMMARLEKMGLVRTYMGTGRFWHPTKAKLTEKGREALRETKGGQ